MGVPSTGTNAVWSQSFAVGDDGQAAILYALSGGGLQLHSTMSPAQAITNSLEAFRGAIAVEVLNALVRVLTRLGVADVVALVRAVIAELGLRVYPSTVR